MLNLIPYRKGYKWGFVDKDKRIVIQCKYTQTYPINDDLGLVRDGTKWGVINRLGRFITPTNFYAFEIIFDNVIAVCTEQRGKIGFFIVESEKLTPLIYDSYTILEGKALAIKKEERYAFMNSNGHFLTEFIYFGCGIPLGLGQSQYFNENLIIARNKKGYLCIDNHGKEVPFQENHANNLDAELHFEDKLLDFGVNIFDKNNNKIGGQFGAFREIDSAFNEGLASLKKKPFWSSKYKYGFVDKKGKTIIPFEYENVGYFSEGLSSAKKNGYWGFIDRDNKTQIEFEYIDLHGGFENGLVPVSKYLGYKKVWFFIDKKGHISSKVFEGDYFHRNQRVIIKKDNLLGVIDFNGKETIPCEFESVKQMDNYFFAIKNETHTIFDYNGIEVIQLSHKPNFFDKHIYKKKADVHYFSEGFGLSYTDSKLVRFVSLIKGKNITKHYKSIYHFHNGLAFVQEANGEHYEWGFIDENGNEYWEDKIMFRRPFTSDPHFSIDENGKEVIEGWGASIDYNRVLER